ncbi:hypothetical protein RHODGE_RHODGE_03283 [Rhodoplanes serenus]|uniref:AAA+ ATPase domain-containing protein n=1 Tax=Rhodoplanes serenus TaxID=200615 RepID=A0A447CXT8_9BRAD|nr:AAA family ATPase [Rhodoplanes serenus]VCU10097.1 hypothetical protein RHODGE_RHODGE_03283 [Rhodoplanes serenus]
MAFTFAPAVRDRVSLLIALAGASGSGKTLSALRLARGLADGDDGRIAVIDTEAGRAKHYAVAPGETPSAERFGFAHGDLRPPFSPEAYADAVATADAAGFDVIVIDSCSHEYEGEGGLHDMHAANVEMAIDRAKSAHNPSWGPFDEARAAERASIGAWKEPKRLHKRFVHRLLQCRAHLILCLRAEEKMRVEQIEEERNGRTFKRTVIVQPKDMPPNERWAPICEKRFMYEMTISLILTPDDPGKPIPIKLQQQHRGAVPIGKVLSEEAGRALSAWARGGHPARRPAAPAGEPAGEPADDVGAPAPGGKTLSDHDDALTEAAAQGTDELRRAWQALPADIRAELKTALDRRHKPAAAAADAARQPKDEEAAA